MAMGDTSLFKLEPRSRIDLFVDAVGLVGGLTAIDKFTTYDTGSILWITGAHAIGQLAGEYVLGGGTGSFLTDLVTTSMAAYATGASPKMVAGLTVAHVLLHLASKQVGDLVENGLPAN